MQTRFKEGEIVKLTEIDRLQLIRQRYYDILLNEITIYNNRKKDKIISYQSKVKDLDRQIVEAKKRLKS